ncbi:MAG: type II secretion system protein [Firmicutes bacterium]|nr:type II secretion system protein [Bacillota bacterium]
MNLWQKQRSSSTDTTACSRGEQAGFTLIEVLVASAVIALIMVSVVPLLVASQRALETAVDQGSFLVRAQKLLSQMIDGKEGLISAKDYAVYSEQNGYRLALSYVVGGGGSDSIISYQWDGNTLYRSVSAGNNLAQPPGGVGTPVFGGVTHFVVDDSDAPTISVEIGSGEILLQTKVTLRN